MVATRISQLTLCAVFAGTVFVSALQNIAHMPAKSEVSQAWDPFNIFRSDNDSQDASTLNLNAGANSNALVGDPTKPRMLVSNSCDASNAILRHAHGLLALHGINTPSKNVNRLFAQYLKPHAEDQFHSIGNAIMAMKKQFQKDNKTITVRGVIGRDRDVMFSKTLYNMGTQVVLTTRRNSMDNVVCMIKDCLGKHMGHAVMKGAKSKLCRARRKDDSIDYKAYVDVSTLADNILKYEESITNSTDELQKFGYKVVTLQIESLLDFEWNKDAVWTSLPAWKHFLEAWGVLPDQKKIVAYLKENVGTSKPPRSHTDAIFNFDAVKNELEDHSKYQWMLRE